MNITSLFSSSYINAKKIFSGLVLGMVCLGLAAAEYRVPLDGVRTFDNRQDWFLTHEESYPLSGEAVDSLAEFSTSVWVRVREYPVERMADHRHQASIFSRGWSQELRLTPGGELINFYCMTDREDIFLAKAHLRKGYWAHVVTTFSVSKQQLATYLNGIKTSQYDLGISPIRPQAAGCKLTVGQSAENWNPFDGEVADLRWFDHALSAEEVQALYENPLPEVAAQRAEAMAQRDLLAVYPVSAPLGDGMILPQTQFDGVQQADELSVTLAAGEYEPGALALHAPTENLQAIQVVLTQKPVNAETGATLPASAIDLKYVQCWFQAGSAWVGVGPEMNVAKLVPELLVNDPELVMVDYATANQYVKLGGPDGALARNVHSRKQINGSRWNLRYPVADNNDIRDAESLLPFSLQRGMTRELFVTVHAPEDAAPGEYVGRIEFHESGMLMNAVSLKVTVLPFRLATPRLARDLDQPFVTSLYYTNGMDAEGSCELNPMRRTEAQLAVELADLKAHGFDNPFNYQLQTAPFDLELFRKMLRMRAAAGLSNRPAYLSGPEANLMKHYDASPESIADLRKKVRDIIAVVQEECGHSEVYFYGVDEANAEKVAQQKPLWDAIHEEGGRVLTSDCSVSCFGADLDGKLLDLLTLCRDSSPEWAAKRHATGGQVFSYGNPQGGVENPLAYRRNYGLRLWKHGYDGFATYCYYEAFGHPWDDFDSRDYRDHNLVYPTADGVIDTVAWEGYREAVDDIRYASTLALAIRENPAHPQAVAAKAFLDGVTGEEPDLDAVRREIVAWILKLRE